MSPLSEQLELQVKSVTMEAEGICSYELRLRSGADLPEFDAGAHIDLALPQGLSRSYSLVNDPRERHRYVIAVQKNPNSRGGSRWIHQHLHAGDLIKVGVPRNNFRLAEDASLSILIAGGIGITPFVSMMSRLLHLQKPWELHYCARTRDHAAFLAMLESMLRSAPAGLGKIKLNFDQAPGGAMLDLAEVVASAPSESHLYCCGPSSMLSAFKAATVNIPEERIHLEYFSATEAPSTEGGFNVILAKSNTVVFVEPGCTILDMLLSAGIDAPYSCKEGVCGTCETRVLQGVPDHHDLILSTAEHASNKTMMICCSGSKSATLTLDL